MVFKKQAIVILKLIILILFILGSNVVFAQKALYAWGLNSNGQLGIGNNTDVNVPTRAGIYTNWSSISSGNFHTIGINTDGEIWTWGYNNYGQLGIGNLIQKTAPVRVGTDNNWRIVAAGSDICVAIKNDNTLWGWGINQAGNFQLGLGVSGVRNSPVQIGTDNDWSTVDAGGDFGVAIKTNGTVWAWGVNDYGQMGDGTLINKSVPTQIGTDTDWAKVFCGGEQTYLIKTNGTLWATGRNHINQLGNGNNTDILTYSQIGVASDWVYVNIIGGATVSTKADNSLWLWGYNGNYQLGLGNQTNQTSPIKFGTDNEWSSAATSRLATIATKTDGTLWGWGNNQNGAVGDGSIMNITSFQSTPYQISTVPYWGKVFAGFRSSFAFLNLVVPVCSTSSEVNLIYNAVNVSGDVTYDGGESITSRGIVYSANSAPTISDNVYYISGTTGTFTETIKNLTSGTTYYARTFAINSIGVGYGDIITFTTPFSDEDYAPNNGDGNNDGIKDSDQNYVHSIFNTNTQKYITIVSLDNYEILNPIIQVAADSLYYYPGGLVKFTIAQSQANMKIIYHSIQSLAGNGFRKLNSLNKYFFLPNTLFGVEIIDGKYTATVRFTLTDGGIGDYDGETNGSITDPGGPAILALNANIPTLSEWARISLVLIMICFGVYYIKKKIL